MSSGQEEDSVLDGLFVSVVFELLQPPPPPPRRLSIPFSDSELKRCLEKVLEDHPYDDLPTALASSSPEDQLDGEAEALMTRLA